MEIFFVERIFRRDIKKRFSFDEFFFGYESSQEENKDKFLVRVEINLRNMVSRNFLLFYNQKRRLFVNCDNHHHDHHIYIYIYTYTVCLHTDATEFVSVTASVNHTPRRPFSLTYDGICIEKKEVSDCV